MVTFSLENYSSINADHKKFDLTNKYGFIPTTRVADTLAKYEWLPIKASQVNIRNKENDGFQKHMIRFRHKNASSIIAVDTVFPEILLVNSHDGFSSFNLSAGLFRTVCLNGLVVADSTFETYRIKHIGYTENRVKIALDAVLDCLPKIASKIKNFQAIDLTKDEQGIYAMSAIKMRYSDAEKREFDIDKLLLPKRSADVESTLWNVYNRIQEKFIKGNDFAVKTDKYGRKRTVRNRGIRAITEDVRVNKALWLLTERMAELKMGGIAVC